MKYIVSLIIFVFTVSFVAVEKYHPRQENLINPFQVKPGLTPVPFAIGEISTSANEWGSSFSSEGKEFYYTTNTPSMNSCIVYIEKVHEGWTKPQIVGFSGVFNDNTPFISPDGNRLFFTSRRPIPSRPDANDANIWYVDKTNDGWSEPRFIKNVSSEKNESFPNIAANGNLYFSASYDNSKGKSDIYMSRYNNGEYELPVNIGDSINTEYGEYCPYIAPDESFMIFESIDRKDGFGGGDLYISKKLANGNWSKAINLGNTFNSEKNDYCVNFSQDRKFMFYSSQRTIRMEKTGASSFENIIKSRKLPVRGGSNIFWIDASFLDKFLTN